MSFFTIPDVAHKTYFEETRFKLTWRFTLFNCWVNFLILLCVWFIAPDLVGIGVLTATLPFGYLLLMKRTANYRLGAILYSLFSGISLGVIINLQLFPFHLAEMIIMLAVTIYSFLVLGKGIGLISLFLNFSSVLYYILFTLQADTNRYYVYTSTEKVAFASVVFIAFLLVFFLLYEFLKLNRLAEEKYLELNAELVEYNHLVKARNTEKTVMLKEIHHRVKNNLQVISSLLRLQSHEIEDETLQIHFQDAVYRVSAMALIHEKMYQNKNLSQIDLENYIHALAEDLVQTHARDIAIRLKVKSEIKELGNDTLVPLALLLNELMMNSLKHAFSKNEDGEIKVEIKRTDPEPYFSFSYFDNGTWKSKQKENSFGLELISSLTEQLDGKVERTYESGTLYRFLLKNR